MTTTSDDRATRPRLLVADPARSYHVLRAEIDEAIARVFERGRFILDAEVAGFEKEFAAYLGCRHVIGVASGTDALRMALIAIGIGPGDEVITVANAGDPTPMAIWSVGATPRLVDVDPVTYTMSVVEAEKAIGPRTRALLPVHLYGQAADLDGLTCLARSAGIRLIEDACQAHGALYRGHRLGTVGDFGCFSFYPTKNLGAFGDGGAVVTNDDALADRARLVREYGWRPRNRSLVKGINSRLDELQAAILRVKLAHLDRGNARRRQIAESYRRGIGKLTGAAQLLTLPREAPENQHVYHLYVVRTSHRDELRRRLAEKGVGTGIHYPTPTHLQPSWQGTWPAVPSLPVTEQLAGEVLSLPMFPEMADDEVERVVEAIGESLTGREG